ncbi:hypothetical protein FACS1894170_05140 [Planctomycetales bacterium]|nr:hypothetical protein FACS1894170_05140 [Planctomycetales bacterium]
MVSSLGLSPIGSFAIRTRCIPTRACNAPVKIAAREGLQYGQEDAKSVNRLPSLASLSKLGVGIEPPKGAMSPYPKSSMKIKTMFGVSSAAKSGTENKAKSKAKMLRNSIEVLLYVRVSV